MVRHSGENRRSLKGRHSLANYVKQMEEGGQAKAVQLTGSRHLQRYSHNIWMFERDAHGETELERNTSTVRVVKNREHGTTGFINLQFDPMTTRMSEISADEVPVSSNKDKDIRDDVQNPFFDV